MPNLFKINQSQVKAWRKCRLSWYYKYKLKLQRKWKSRPLTFGTLVHSILELVANATEPTRAISKVLRDAEKSQGQLFRSMAEEYGAIIDDTRIIMTEYFDYYPANSLVPVRMKGKGSEFIFEVPIADGILAKGKIDMVATTPNKLRWLVEHKSGKQPLSEDHKWRNVQSGVYIRVLEMLGKTVDGTCWDFIRSKPPTAPKLLNSGKMSQRGIDTLPLKVSETLKKEKLSERFFGTLLRSAKSNRATYFNRTFTLMKKPVVDAMFNDFVSTAREIADNAHRKQFERTVDRHCDWCEYEGLCRASLLGLDHDFLMKKDYQVVEDPSSEPDFEVN